MAQITFLVGAGADCQYPAGAAGILAAWAAIPADVIGSGNSYRLELDKTALHNLGTATITLSGKTTDATHGIWIGPRTGHGFGSNPNVLTNAYTYNEANGVALKFTGNYQDAIVVDNNYVTIFGLQLYHAGGGNSGTGINMGNGRVGIVLDNLIIKMKAQGNYVRAAGSADAAFSMFSSLAILDSPNSNGVNVGLRGVANGVTVVRPSTYANNLNCGGFTTSGGSASVTNCLVIGSAFSVGTMTGSHNASNGVISFGTGNKENLLAADLFVDPVGDFRTKAGAAIIDAGISPPDSNTKAPAGVRQQGVEADIGAWEFPAPIQAPSATVTDIKVTGQTVVVTYATTGSPTRGTALLTPATMPYNSGEQIAADTQVFSPGSAVVTFKNVKVGLYALDADVSNANFTTNVANALGSVSIIGALATSVVQELNGQILTVHGGVSGQPTAGTLLMPADPDDPQGALDQLVNVVLSVGAYTVAVPLPPGNYAKGILRFTNAAGVSLPQDGTAAVRILGISGNPEAPPQDPPVVVPDTTAPVFAAGSVITKGATTTSSIGFSYPAATDTVGVAKYQITKNGVDWVDNALDLTGSFTALASGTPFPVGVRALDAAGNASNALTLQISTDAVVVVPPVVVPSVTGVTVTPADATINGTTQQFDHVVLGLNNPSQLVDWTCTLGTADANGLLTVARTAVDQHGTITATSRANPAFKATVSFTVAALVVVVDPDPTPDPVPAATGGTKVAMHFLTPDLTPLSDTVIEIQLKTADFKEGIDGILMPRLLSTRTDVNGRAQVTLSPCDTPYYVTVLDSASEAGLFYKFYVPAVADPENTLVRLQDIVVDAELTIQSFDDAAYVRIVQAKEDAIAAAEQVKALIDKLGTGGGGGGSGGVGNTGPAASPGPTATSGNRPEVLLVPDASGVLVPDGKLSNRFRFILNSNLKLGDPVNFANNEHIYFTGYQDMAGTHQLGYGLSLMLPGAQAYVPPQGPKAAFLMELRPTQNIDTNVLNWTVIGYPDKSVATGFGLVTEIAYVGATGYYGMAAAFAAVGNNQTVKVTRNGLGGEVTASKFGVAGETYRIYGAPVAINGEDKRPVLHLPGTDFGEGPPRGANRPAFGKALLNFEGKGTFYVRDLRVRGARNDDSDARGLCPNADAANLIVNNVEISDCCNGILTGNAGYTGVVELYDVLIDKCGVGGPSTDPGHNFSTVGFTHSVYMGHNDSTVKMTRTSLTNAVDGDNLKCRTGTLILDQVLCSGAASGRELEVPNGGTVIATNSSFIKPASSNNGSMVLLGGNGGPPNTVEGLDTSRPRKYKFVNCRFRSDYGVTGSFAGRDGYLICSLDPDVPIEFVDCLFEGDLANSNADDPNHQVIYSGTVTVKGIRYKPSAPPIYTLTGGPLGPLKPVGYFPVPMTPIET